MQILTVRFLIFNPEAHHAASCQHSSLLFRCRKVNDTHLTQSRADDGVIFYGCHKLALLHLGGTDCRIHIHVNALV